MKHVVRSDEVVRLWGNKLQHRAQNGERTIWFEGDVLYSYHTVIARFTRGVDGSEAAIVTARRYSQTTSKQVGWALSFLRRAGVKTFLVDDVSFECSQRFNADKLRDAAFNYARHLRKVHVRPRLGPDVPDTWFERGISALKEVAKVNEYAAFFGVLGMVGTDTAQIAGWLNHTQERYDNFEPTQIRDARAVTRALKRANKGVGR